MQPQNLKICAELTCNNLYVPDKWGKCPRCGSEGIWLDKMTEDHSSPLPGGDAIINNVKRINIIM